MDNPEKYEQCERDLATLKKLLELARRYAVDPDFYETLQELNGLISGEMDRLDRAMQCEHGRLLPEHPHYDPSVDHCRECDWLEAGDIQYQIWKEDR